MERDDAPAAARMERDDTPAAAGELAVRTLDGQRLIVPIAGDRTVAALKQRIQELGGGLADQQTLARDGTTLDNARTLASYGLPAPAAEIHLLLADADDLARVLRDAASSIRFEPLSSALTPAARRSLAPLAAVLAERSFLNVLVEGHIDGPGLCLCPWLWPAAPCICAVSCSRSRAVRDALVRAGAPRAHVHARGRGGFFPRHATCDNENRRVELYVLAPSGAVYPPRVPVCCRIPLPRPPACVNETGGYDSARAEVAM